MKGTVGPKMGSCSKSGFVCGTTMPSEPIVSCLTSQSVFILYGKVEKFLVDSSFESQINANWRGFVDEMMTEE